MKVLMLGNSFTFYHEMPKMLAGLTGADVTAHTRGGAYLAEQLNPETEMGARTLAALKNEKWDFVVLQEQSNAPALHTEAFLRSAEGLGELIRENGAIPVMYATWAYREGTEKLATTGLSYAEMAEKLENAYVEASKRIGARVAYVGRRFTAVREYVDVLEKDDYHPSEAGSALAAATIAEVLMK